jgi:hypothetical protein
VITAVAVVIPARDEAGAIAACLRAVRRSLLALPPRIDRAVCVVADRCSDDTAHLATAAFGGWRSGRVVVNEDALSIGEVRDFGVRAAGGMLARHEPERTLLLSTDADTTVSAGWAREHLARLGEGSHAVAGAAELSGAFSANPLAQHRYQGVLDHARRPDGHGNVYGANLGVRADAYLAVGGFPALPTGEDHDLWRRLGQAGYRLCYDSRALVVTSSRLTGRAPDGLAGLLRRLHRESGPPLGAATAVSPLRVAPIGPGS